MCSSDLKETSAFVQAKLGELGVPFVAGVGGHGVVATLTRGKSNHSVGLRADMDALPITERTGKPYASTTSGKMHACGHDGHTAMLLGAAKYLAETRNFDGTAIVIFQPAEEGGAGGRAMVQDGMMERFGIEEVFGLHNIPGMPVGSFAIREGGIMAATDEFTIIIEGTGGHAAMPHKANDPVVIAAQLILALQTVVSRNIDPMRQAVLSVTMVQAGDAFNIIPRNIRLTGTIRTLDETIRSFMEERLRTITTQLVAAFGAKADIAFRRGYPVTVNAPAQTAFAAEVARSVAGAERVNANSDPTMGGEDFAYMLQARPGAYIFMGNGDSTQLHTDTYDFNDEAIPAGVSYWSRLVEMALPTRN